MNITVYVTNQSGDEVEEKDRLIWYPNLVKAIEAYICIFNNLPQIGIEFLEDDYLDLLTIKGININPISKKVSRSLRVILSCSLTSGKRQIVK